MPSALPFWATYLVAFGVFSATAAMVAAKSDGRRLPSAVTHTVAIILFAINGFIMVGFGLLYLQRDAVVGALLMGGPVVAAAAGWLGIRLVADNCPR